MDVIPLQPASDVGTFSLEERIELVRKVCLHLAAAIYAYGVIEGILVSVVPAEGFFELLRLVPLFVVIVWVGLIFGWIFARLWAVKATVREEQYAGFAMHVICGALLLLPLMLLASQSDYFLKTK